MDEIQVRRMVLNHLRKLWSKWGPRTLALTKARVSYGKYRCAHCKGENFKQPKSSDKANAVQVDHIIPVGAFKSYDQYVERLFVPVSGLQVLCKPCHTIKTSAEATSRAKKRRKAKVKKDV